MKSDEQRMSFLQKLIRTLKCDGVVEKDEGIVVLFFDLGEGGRLTYASSADRDDVVAAMLEFVGRLEPTVLERAYARHRDMLVHGTGVEREN